MPDRFRTFMDTAIARRKLDARKPIQRKVRGGSVLFCPTAAGAVRIIGLDENDGWIAEFSCLEKDYRESYLDRMVRHVERNAGVKLELMG